MAEQSYASHAHHPVPTYVASFLWMVALINLVGSAHFGWHTQTTALFAMLFAVFVTIAIGRAYTVKLQDRIIMLEMKVRCAEVLAAGEDAKLASLTPSQIVGLRFASDAELGALLDRAIREKLSQKAIKAAITTWRPDPYRT